MTDTFEEWIADPHTGNATYEEWVARRREERERAAHAAVAHAGMASLGDVWADAVAWQQRRLEVEMERRGMGNSRRSLIIAAGP